MPKYKDVKVGDILIADDGFDCLLEGQQCIVEKDDRDRKFVRCSEGIHLLDGQLEFYAERGEVSLVGLTLLETISK